MKKIIQYTLVITITTLLITACSKKGPKQALLIPKDASFVMAVDLGSLQAKLDKGGIQLDSSIKKIWGSSGLDASNKLKLAQSKEWGIDYNEKFFLFVTQKGNSSKGSSTTFNLMGSLKDSAKLLAFLKKQAVFEKADIVREQKYAYLELAENFILSWNDKYIIATFSINNQGFHKQVDTMMHTNQTPSFSKTDELKKQVNTYFTQNESESMAAVKPFVELFKERADGYVYSNTNGSMSALSMMPIQLPKLEELLSDNYTTSTFNFEEGKIVSTSNFYPNKLLTAILQKYKGPTVNVSMIENYPSQNLNGFVLVSFNPEIFGGILKQLEIESLADAYLQTMNISSADFYKCLKGDIALVFSDFTLTAPNHSAMLSIPKPVAKFILNANIGDKASFAKLMDKAVETGFIIKQNKVYHGGAIIQSLGLYLHADENNFIVSSDSSTYLQYVAKTNKGAISEEVVKNIKAKSSAFYLDVDKLMGGVMPYGDGEPMKASFNFVKSTFRDVTATADNFDGTKIAAKVEVRMKDDKTNSLISIVNMLVNIVGQVHPKND